MKLTPGCLKWVCYTNLFIISVFLSNSLYALFFRTILIGGKNTEKDGAVAKTWILDWSSETPTWAQGPGKQKVRDALAP